MLFCCHPLLSALITLIKHGHDTSLSFTATAMVTVEDPPLSPLQATLLALFFVSSYVGSLYISKNARLSFVSKSVKLPDGQIRRKQDKERWRDDSDVIRARLTAVALSTVLSCFVVYWVRLRAFAVRTTTSAWCVFLSIVQTASEARADTLKRLGFTAPHPVVAHLITPVLFLGPLYAMSLYRTLPFQKLYNLNNVTWIHFKSLLGIRTYVVVSGLLRFVDVYRLIAVAGAYYRRGCVQSMHALHIPFIGRVGLSYDIPRSAMVRPGWVPFSCVAEINAEHFQHTFIMLGMFITATDEPPQH